MRKRDAEQDGPYVLRVVLLKEIPPQGQGKKTPTQEVIDAFEVAITDEREGMEAVEACGDMLEEEFGKELFDWE